MPTPSTPRCPPRRSPTCVKAVHVGESPLTIAIELGPRFASFKSADAAGERGAGRIVVDDRRADHRGASRRAQQPAAPAAPETPPLLDIAPAGAAAHHRDRCRPRRRRTRRTRTAGHARKGRDARRRAAAEGGASRPASARASSSRATAIRPSASTSARRVANNNKADLFISLHANASVRGSAAGAEVFYLSLGDYGAQAQRVAQGESEALPVFGGGTRDIDVILWEMAQARHIEQSAALATAVEASLRAARADEPARHPAGAVPRARRRQHAGGARRDGLHHQSRTGAAARLRGLPVEHRPGAGRQPGALPRQPDRAALHRLRCTGARH